MVGHKIIRIVSFVDTDNKHWEKDDRQSLFSLVSKTIKHVKINITKEMNELYDKIFKYVKNKLA